MVKISNLKKFISSFLTDENFQAPKGDYEEILAHLALELASCLGVKSQIEIADGKTALLCQPNEFDIKLLCFIKSFEEPQPDLARVIQFTKSK